MLGKSGFDEGMENLSEYIILIYFYGDTQGAKYFSARSSALHPISKSSHIPPLHILRAGNMDQLRPSMPSQLLQFLLPNLWRQGDCCAAWDSPLGARPFKPRLQAPGAFPPFHKVCLSLIADGGATIAGLQRRKGIIRRPTRGAC